VNRISKNAGEMRITTQYLAAQCIYVTRFLVIVSMK